MNRSHSWFGAILLVLAVLAATLFVGVSVAEATQAAPNVVKAFEQPDGAVVPLRLWGDEFAHGWESLDGYTVVYNADTGYWEYAVRDATGWLAPSGKVVGTDAPPTAPGLKPSQTAIDQARAERAAPTVSMAPAAAPPWAGSDTDVLFIMVAFTDVSCTFTANDFQNNLFGGNASGPGDLDDYFREISYGELELDGNVVGCYTLANNRSHYDDGPGDAVDVVEEAVALADSDVDFSQYDNDGDGTVDALGIIYAGGGTHDGCAPDSPPSGSAGDDLWPHSWDTGGTSTSDGVNVNHYIIQSEITYGIADGVCDEMQTIGLFAHEFGHALGLPDLYDTDGSSSGVGSWSSMASQFRSTVNNADTPPHYDPWSKWIMGWITPVDYTGQDIDAGVPRVEETGFVVRLLNNPGGPEEGGTGEYFLVENRQLVDFDSALPGCGLLIWHIEESMTHNKNEGHTTASHRLVDIEEADGLDQLDAGTNRGDAGDPYPGSTTNRLFADATYPTANLYDGSPSGVRVADIGDCAPVMAVNFGNPDADVAITKIDSPDPVVAGEALYYDVSVTNYGPAAATNVQVIDVLPAGVDYVTSTGGYCTENPAGTLTCDLGDILSGATKSFTVQVKVDVDIVANAGGPTSLSNTASVTADQPDDDLTNNQATATTIVNDLADLRLSKLCKPDGPVLVGETATCTIEVENLGPSTARNVEVIDEHISNGTFTIGAVTPAGSCTVSGGTVSCDLGDVDPGEKVTITVPITASEPQDVNDLATVSSDTPDPNPGNNWDEDGVSFFELADLEVFKECKPDVPGTPLYAGEIGICTIRMKNWGPSVASAVELTDVHTAGTGEFSFGAVTPSQGGPCTVSANPQHGSGTITCPLGSLAPGAEATVEVEVTTDEGMDINDTATAYGAEADPNIANNSATDGLTFVAAADLALTKTATPDPVVAGTQLTYDLEVTNNGPSTAVNVVIEDVLPVGVGNVSVSASAGSCNAGVPGDASLPTTCTFDSLAPMDSETMQIVVDVHPSVLDVLGNNARVYSETYDPDNSNNLATTDTDVEAEADLSVTKADYPDPVLAGEMLTYELTVANAGPSTAVDVALTDVLPAEVAFQYYTVSNGSGTCSHLLPNTIDCNLNDLLPGQYVKVFIYVSVDPSVPDGTVIVDEATVSSATFDPNPGNNMATADTTVLARADLALTKDANFLTDNPSKRIVYTLTFTNHGPSDAQNVILVDTLPLDPKKIVYVMDSGNGACVYDEGSHTVTCDFGTVAAGEVVTVDIIVDARGSVRRITNVADVTSSTTDQNPSNNHAEKEIRVKGGPGNDK